MILKTIKSLLLPLLAFAISSCHAEEIPENPSAHPPQTMKIQLKIGGETLTATLQDSVTTRDFISQLPLTLDMRDYNRTEKIADLPKKLTMKDSPPGSDPSIGDITYYAPWGNLAIFYKDFGYSNGLIILGKLDSGIETLAKAADGKLTIDLAKP